MTSNSEKIDRILEPEVMDSEKEATEYDQMDHSEVNRIFVDDFLSFISKYDSIENIKEQLVLDVGTGTGLIPIELCQRDSQWNVIGIDLAQEMILKGEANIGNSNLKEQVELICCDAKSTPFPDKCYSIILSNSIVHHIPEPKSVFREMIRLLKNEGCLFIRDLLRPNTNDEVEELVSLHAAKANEYQQQLFRQSLQAALTIDEVREILRSINLPAEAVQQTSDRHWTIQHYTS